MQTSHYPSTSAYAYIPRPIPAPSAPPEEHVLLTPAILEESLLPLVAAQLTAAGFTHAERGAVQWIEDTAIRLVQDLFEQATERAEGQGRSRANALDLWDVIERDGGIKGGVEGLGEIVKARRGQPALGLKLIAQENPPQPSGLEDIADDEYDPAQRRSFLRVPTHLDYAPAHLPDLPPPHTYLRHRDAPTRQPTTLASLDKQVSESRLAEDALRRLVRALSTSPSTSPSPLPSAAPSSAVPDSHTNGNGTGTPVEGSMPPPSWIPAGAGGQGVELGPVVNWERGRMMGRRWDVRRR